MRSAIAGTSSRPRTGTARSGSGSSEATATTVGSSRAISGVPRSARWTSTLGWGKLLKPSTITRSAGERRARIASSGGSGSSRSSWTSAQRRAVASITSARTRLAVAPAVLARPVEVGLVVGVLDGRDPVAARHEVLDQPHHQGGLAVVLPADDADDPHARPAKPSPAQAGGARLISYVAERRGPGQPGADGVRHERADAGYQGAQLPAAGAEGAKAPPGDAAGRAADSAGDGPQGAG